MILNNVSSDMIVFHYFQVSGAMPAKPCSSFAHFGFDDQLMTAIRKSDYVQPTPIQCQVLSTYLL